VVVRHPFIEDCNITGKGVRVAFSWNLWNMISPIGRLEIGEFCLDGKRGTDTREAGNSSVVVCCPPFLTADSATVAEAVK